MSDIVKIRYSIRASNSGSTCSDVIGFDREDWAGMTEDQQEAKIREYAFDDMDWYYESVDDVQYQTGLPATSAQVAVVPEWVSVKDQYPPIIGQCLGWNATKNMKHGAGTYRLFVACAENTHEISHWMLLPEPPPGSESNG